MPDRRFQARINFGNVNVARIDEYFDNPWAINPDKARSLMFALERFGLEQHIAHHRERNVQTEVMRDETGFGGRAAAIIKIQGVMMKGRTSFGTSMIEVRHEVRAAAADPGISCIVLLFDTPGGTVSGTEDLARDVAEAATVKPVVGFVEDFCASAGYWVGSQCELIFANNGTAGIGSIGNYIGLYDYSKHDESAGIEALVFQSGELKATGFPGSRVTEAQREYLQGIVNDTQAFFDAAVISGRGFGDEDIAAVRSGAVFMAKDALRLKLIDGVKTFEETVQTAFDLASNAHSNRKGITMPEPNNTQANTDSATEQAASKNLPATAEAAGQGRENASDSRPAGKPLATSKEKPAADGEADNNSAPSAEVVQDANDTVNNADAGAQSKPSAKSGADEKAEPTGGAATLAQLNEALPKASSDFKLKCLEDGVSLAEAQTRYIAEVEASNEKLEQRLAGAPRGSDEPVSADDADAPTQSAEDARLDAAIGANTARFARGLKLPANANATNN